MRTIAENCGYSWMGFNFATKLAITNNLLLIYCDVVSFSPFFNTHIYRGKLCNYYVVLYYFNAGVLYYILLH